MDGSAADFIVIPIVAVISLAAWLVMVYWADSHPLKSPRRPTPTAGQVSVPRQATAPAEDQDLISARR